MSTDFKEKRELAQYFIRCYVAARQGLSRLGILRSERILQADYAGWLVSELLGLQLASSAIQKEYDARDNQRKTYQIKSRLGKRSAYREESLVRLTTGSETMTITLRTSTNSRLKGNRLTGKCFALLLALTE